jgi:hypothetical protein
LATVHQEVVRICFRVSGFPENLRVFSSVLSLNAKEIFNLNKFFSKVTDSPFSLYLVFSIIIRKYLNKTMLGSYSVMLSFPDIIFRLIIESLLYLSI